MRDILGAAFHELLEPMPLVSVSLHGPAGVEASVSGRDEAEVLKKIEELWRLALRGAGDVFECGAGI